MIYSAPMAFASFTSFSKASFVYLLIIISLTSSSNVISFPLNFSLYDIRAILIPLTFTIRNLCSSLFLKEPVYANLYFSNKSRVCNNPLSPLSVI